LELVQSLSTMSGLFVWNDDPPVLFSSQAFFSKFCISFLCSSRLCLNAMQKSQLP
jgi:hypothetical protein